MFERVVKQKAKRFVKKKRKEILGDRSLDLTPVSGGNGGGGERCVGTPIQSRRSEALGKRE